MEHTGTPLIANSALMLTLLVAFAAALFRATIYWRQRSVLPGVISRQSASPASQIIYNDSPTVRVVDAQRVDRLRKVVQLAVGAHVDVLEVQSGSAPRFRITLKAVTECADGTFAQVAVELRGTPLSCGPLVREISGNEFLMPRAGRDEPRSAVFHYHERGDALDFLRIKIRALDPHAKTAEIDVMQVLGHWPTSD